MGYISVKGKPKSTVGIPAVGFCFPKGKQKSTVANFSNYNLRNFSINYFPAAGRKILTYIE